MNDHVKTIDKLLDSINIEPAVIEEFSKWGKVVQLNLDEEKFFIDFGKNLGKFSIQTGVHPSPNFTITSSLSSLLQIFNGEIEAIEAVVNALVSIQGSITDALEFSELVSKIKDELSD